MKTYIIWTPPYLSNSGGIRALFTLCHELNKRGQKAFVTSPVVCPGLINPFLNMNQFNKMVNLDDVNVVYPEIVRGNPWNFKNVIRWVLQVPGMLNGDREYAETEKVFTWSESYMPNGGYLGKLNLPLIELDLFNTDNVGIRSGGCFWVHKGWQTPKIPETENLPEIIGAWPPTRKELAYFLKTREYLYTYDNCTALIDEARLCGCPVIIIPDLINNYNNEKLGDLVKLGTCNDIKDIEKARSELPMFRELYMKKYEEFELQINKFIELT